MRRAILPLELQSSNVRERDGFMSEHAMKGSLGGSHESWLKRVFILETTVLSEGIL